jgi:Periplasmic protease
MGKKFIITTVALFLSFGAIAQDLNPLWIRYPAISPNGKSIVFSYKGDLFRVASSGGLATAITTNPAYDYSPVWSPDGKTIAFASDRSGNMDIYTVPAEGGMPTQLTTISAEEIPYCFTPDGANVLYGASIQDPAVSAMFPAGYYPEIYTVPTKGGRSSQLLAVPMENVVFSKNGTELLYNDIKGQENDWRKHQTSSVTRDLWSYNLTSKKFTKLTDSKVEYRQPIPFNNMVYFLSERSGSFNVWAFSEDNPSQLKQITSFTKDPVRFLSGSTNGMLCYTYRGEIYIQKLGEEPQKVQLKIATDASENAVETLRLSTGATESTVSTDGKEVALVIRGEIFVTSTDYSTTKRITNTPEQERSVSFSPDGKMLVYASERNGSWNLYIAIRANANEPNFSNATVINEEPLLVSTEETFQPKFGPDGKEVAFLENRTKLKVINLESKKVREITDGTQNSSYSDGDIDFDWSPDGKWLVLDYNPSIRFPHTDIGIVSAEGGRPVVNLTESGYTETNPHWVMKGDAIIWLSEREGMINQSSWGAQRDVYAFFINQKVYDKFNLSKEEYELLKEKEKNKNDGKENDKNIKAKVNDAHNIDFTNLEDRILRLTINSSNISDAVLTPDGDKLYYLTQFEDGFDLWVNDLRKKETKLMVKLNGRSGSLSLDSTAKNLFVMTGGVLSKIEIATDKKSNIGYRAELELNHPKEREYMFNHVARQVEEKYFRTDLNGVDWKYYTTEYRRFLPSINNNYDFAELLSEMLGEMNCSHTGSGYRPRNDGNSKTSSLGLIFDLTYQGEGIRVAEVLEKGPFTKAESKLKSGNIIEKINGVSILPGEDYFPLLNRIDGQNTLISIYDTKSGARWDEVIKPISRGAENELLYQRWVKNRKHDVDSLSGGRLGYVHIRGMNDPSYRTIYSDIFGKYNSKEGIVIDTRYNGGGHLHEDIETLFSGKKYLDQIVRGQKVGEQPRKRWKKPSIMLISEANYSNAHGTPWVYKTMKIGNLVGMPVPGTMSSVWWETLQDPTLYFGIPVVGYMDSTGRYLENSQLEPDIVVPNLPTDITTGVDSQIKAAVDELLKEIDSKEKE